MLLITRGLPLYTKQSFMEIRKHVSCCYATVPVFMVVKGLRKEQWVWKELITPGHH